MQHTVIHHKYSKLKAEIKRYMSDKIELMLQHILPSTTLLCILKVYRIIGSICVLKCIWKIHYPYIV